MINRTLYFPQFILDMVILSGQKLLPTLLDVTLLTNLHHDHAILDFQECIEQHTAVLFPFIYSYYSTTSLHVFMT